MAPDMRAQGMALRNQKKNSKQSSTSVASKASRVAKVDWARRSGIMPARGRINCHALSFISAAVAAILSLHRRNQEPRGRMTCRLFWRAGFHAMLHGGWARFIDRLDDVQSRCAYSGNVNLMQQ